MYNVYIVNINCAIILNLVNIKTCISEEKASC